VREALATHASTQPAKQRGFGTGSWEWCLGALEALCQRGLCFRDKLPMRLQVGLYTMLLLPILYGV